MTSAMRRARALLKLTWLEIKIFVREPLGVIGTLGMPLAIFWIFGRITGGRRSGVPSAIGADLPILASMLIALSAVLSLVAIVAIYREGGILKRLRATPLTPATILTAHVLVKLLFAALSVAALMLAGRRILPPQAAVPYVSFAAAVLLGTLVVLAIGFVVASLVPTARFAQPVGTLVFYPMLVLSGLFFPVEVLPPVLRAIASVLPLTYAVRLMRGVWNGESWLSHAPELAVLGLFFAGALLLSSRVFRWE